MKTNNEGLGVYGKYLLLKKLAEGGMAEVFLSRPAAREGNGRVQVVKRILPQIARNTTFLNMFQSEIQLIMGFNHPNIVQLHDFGTIAGRPYIAMEYIEGKSLREILDKVKSLNGSIPVPMVLSFIAQAAAGLHYAHTFTNTITGQEPHAVHRDISPQNLIVSYEGNLKVIDFGIAKAASGVQELTQTGTIKGKVAYFAPEQIDGTKLDCRTDIFALGVVAWELLTGQRLFVKNGDTEVTVMARVSNCEKHVVRPSDINGDVPIEVDNIIMSCLEKNPSRRFSNASHLQTAIRKVLGVLYPNYSYADTGKLVCSLFEKEIALERAELREMNITAQRMLDGNLSDKTQVSSTEPTRVNKKRPSSAKVGAAVDFRLSKVEAALKQKATLRHYVMLAFYIVSIVGLKVSERYDFSIGINSKYAKANEANVQSVPQQVADQVQKQIPQAGMQNYQAQPHTVQAATANRQNAVVSRGQNRAGYNTQATYAKTGVPQLKSQTYGRQPATTAATRAASAKKQNTVKRVINN